MIVRVLVISVVDWPFTREPAAERRKFLEQQEIDEILASIPRRINVQQSLSQ